MKTVFLFISLFALSGCGAFWRTEVKTDSHVQKETVTKETEVVKGAGEWDHTVTRYKEEISKETAGSEQSREHSSPAAAGLISLLDSAGLSSNPILALILSVFGGKLALSGANAVSAAGTHVVSKMKKPKKAPNV